METDPNCIFCKIVAGAIPSPRVYEDENVICIRDIQPQAATHLLILPRSHVTSLETLFRDGAVGDPYARRLMGDIYMAADRVAKQTGLLPGKGYRTVINVGADGGQTVHHLHMHLLGGEALAGRFA